MWVGSVVEYMSESFLVHDRMQFQSEFFRNLSSIAQTVRLLFAVCLVTFLQPIITC